MFQGADVDALDGMAGRCELASAAADGCRTTLAAATTAPWVFGPFGAAFTAYLSREAVLCLDTVAEALRRFAVVLRAHAEAQRRASAGDSVPVLSRYTSPVSQRTPYDQRIRDCRAQISAELDRRRAELADLERRHAPAKQIEQARRRIATYERLLAPERQIILFDPTGDGAVAELHGMIGPKTRNVGVLVPGTTTDIDNFDGFSQRGRTFVDASPDGDLAVIVWMGGDLPDKLVSDAPSQRYADDLGPKLADFSRDLRQEISADVPAATGVHVTVAGHSYGGAVVGTAERFGLDADRVLHIESAGMGHGVDGPEEYHNPRPDVRRYSMTAPGDPIGLTQGVTIGSIGHGTDPDEFPGVTRLDTGRYADGRRVEGVAAHGGVFEPGSDAWRNMHEVLVGGTVTQHQEWQLTPRFVPGPFPRVDWDEVPPKDPPKRIDIP